MNADYTLVIMGDKKGKKEILIILIQVYECIILLYCFSGITRATEREDDDVPALRSRTEWETGAALKTYAAVRLLVVQRWWRRCPDLGARRQDARGAAEGFTRSFSGQARCIKKPPQERDPSARLSNGGGKRTVTHGAISAQASPFRNYSSATLRLSACTAIALSFGCYAQNVFVPNVLCLTSETTRINWKINCLFYFLNEIKENRERALFC